MLLFPDAVMIASETKGPMNALVFPMTENSAKNRNLSLESVSVPRIGKLNAHLREGRDLCDHRLAVGIPRAYHEAIVRLVRPDLPNMLETDIV